MRRIVFHTSSLRGGGAERVFVLMANELASRGHEVIFFTWNAEGPNAGLLAPNVRLVDFALPIRREGFGKLATLRALWRSARLFRELRPDAVYSAPEFANLLMALALVLAGSRARFFPSYHAAATLPSIHLGARLAIIFATVVIRRADKAIAVSSGVGRDIAARGIPDAKIVVINNPLPSSTAGDGEGNGWMQQLAAMGDGPVIATAGRLVPVKDHRTLLAAFAELRRHRPARLVLFGEGPLEADLKQYARELGIAGSVLFPGYVTNPRACYAAADVFVLSSITEGFGNVLIEAMAAGVPVVSTDAPHGPREILGSGRYGRLVSIRDPQALARALAAELDEPTPAEVLKRRAADFDVRIIGDKYEALVA